MYIITLICLCVAFIGAVGLIGYISYLSHKERRELNNRLMCKSVDEYIKLSSSEDKAASAAPRISEHRRRIKEFEAKGVTG